MGKGHCAYLKILTNSKWITWSRTGEALTIEEMVKCQIEHFLFCVRLKFLSEVLVTGFALGIGFVFAVFFFSFPI